MYTPHASDMPAPSCCFTRLRRHKMYTPHASDTPAPSCCFTRLRRHKMYTPHASDTSAGCTQCTDSFPRHTPTTVPTLQRQVHSNTLHGQRLRRCNWMFCRLLAHASDVTLACSLRAPLTPRRDVNASDVAALFRGEPWEPRQSIAHASDSSVRCTLRGPPC